MIKDKHAEQTYQSYVKFCKGVGSVPQDFFSWVKSWGGWELTDGKSVSKPRSTFGYSGVGYGGAAYRGNFVPEPPKSGGPQ